MVETLHDERLLHADDPLQDASALSVGTLLEVSAAPPYARFIVRGRGVLPDAVGPVLGFSLPSTPCRAVEQEGCAALWLGPDEWLILVPLAQGENRRQALAAALSPHPHALVAVSSRQLGLCIGGLKASSLLAHGCPLDLSLAAFPIGMSTRTLFQRAEIVLWRHGAAVFQLEIARSLVPYVLGLIAEIRREFAGEPA